MAIATEDKSEQRTPGWHAIRAGRATASNFATIIVDGKGSETYALQVALEGTSGRVKETFQSFAMKEGTELEMIAKLEYELQTGAVVTDCGFFAHNEIRAGASPDGLLEDDGLIETKCPLEATHLATLKTGKIPNQYYWQMMGQMWMTERKWCDYVSYNPYFPVNSQLYIKRVERDEEAIERLEKAVRKFLVDVAREEQFIKQYQGKGGQVTVTRVTT